MGDVLIFQGEIGKVYWQSLTIIISWVGFWIGLCPWLPPDSCGLQKFFDWFHKKNINISILLNIPPFLKAMLHIAYPPAPKWTSSFPQKPYLTTQPFTTFKKPAKSPQKKTQLELLTRIPPTPEVNWHHPPQKMNITNRFQPFPSNSRTGFCPTDLGPRDFRCRPILCPNISMKWWDALVSTLRSMSSSSSSRVESNTTDMDTDGCVFCFLRIVGSWKVFFLLFFS